MKSYTYNLFFIKDNFFRFAGVVLAHAMFPKVMYKWESEKLNSSLTFIIKINTNLIAYVFRNFVFMKVNMILSI